MPTFSDITIEFLRDFEVDFEIRTTTSYNGNLTPLVWTWVVTRSAGFEVTTGTPTGTTGERTAINFEAAFDLDYPTGYVTTQTTNTIVIQSETEGFDFIRFNAVDENGTLLVQNTDFIVTFNNYVEPVDYSTIEFAMVKSPHYVNIPFNFTTTTSATINLFVWDGALASVPSTATRTLTIPRPSTNFTEFNVDLSGLIRDRIDPTPNIDLAANVQIVDSLANSVKWVKYTASYTDPTEIIADIEGTFVGVDGYGWYSEGANPTKPTNNILTSSTTRKIDRNGFVLLPIVNNGTIASIDADSDTSEIDEFFTITPSDNSTDMVQYVEIDVSQAQTDDYLTVTTNPAGDVITYEIIDECRYNPIHIVFKNKFGAFDVLNLFKKSDSSIDIKNDDFVNNYVSGGTYDTTKHQFQKININGKETVSCNTGYINEEENNIYKELLLSETVYIYKNSALIPINITTKSLGLKTRVNNGLVNYSIDFEYAYNLIQNV